MEEGEEGGGAAREGRRGGSGWIENVAKEELKEHGEEGWSLFSMGRGGGEVTIGGGGRRK